jgi:sulfoxide reductase heme-binding subunit YedZ
VIPIALASVGPHLFWLTSRAAGVAAVILSSAAVGAGLLISSGRIGGRRKIGDARPLHEALSLATLLAIAVHGLSLLGDHFLHPSIAEISVPFVGAYRPLWTGVGIVAGWGLVALGLSFYARGRIGQTRWRSLHRFTALFWVLGVVHSIGSGSDAEQPWFLLALGLTAAPAALLLVAKLSRGRPAAAPAPRGASASREPATVER